MLSPKEGAKKIKNCGGSEDAGSDADGSFASCISEPASPTWYCRAISPQRKFDLRKQGDKTIGIAALSAQCVSSSPPTTSQGRLQGICCPSPGKCVSEIHLRQRSSLPLVDFLERFKPSPPPPPRLSPPSSPLAVNKFLPRAGHPWPKQCASSSSSANNSLLWLQSSGNNIKNHDNGEDDDDDGTGEEQYEMEEHDTTPSTPLILKRRKLNYLTQSKHSNSPPSPHLRSFAPHPPLPTIKLNRIDEEATERTVEVRKEEARPKRTWRWRIRNLIPLPWKKRRKKCKRRGREEEDGDSEGSCSLSSGSCSPPPPPMMITITEDGEAIIQKCKATRSSLRRRSANARVGRWGLRKDFQ